MLILTGNMLGKYLGINVNRTGHTSIRGVHCPCSCLSKIKPLAEVNQMKDIYKLLISANNLLKHYQVNTQVNNPLASPINSQSHGIKSNNYPKLLLSQ
jgi:hypothetical protein